MSTEAIPATHTMEASEASSAVTYPCRFPGCAFKLGADLLYVPKLEWMNREVGHRRPVTDWITAATESEMAEFARCQHHAWESVVGIDYNRRHGILTMTRFSDLLKLVDYKRDQAQCERDANREAYGRKREREKEANKARRQERKLRLGYRTSLQQVGPKKFGDEKRAVIVEAAPSKKKGKKNKKDADQKKGGKGKGR